jgi:tetratricopeptide (TPR) repeat protein
MTRSEVLKKYYDIVATDSAKARQLIKQLDYKKDPYLLQCIAQTYLDESLFKNDGSSRGYFITKKLRLAEKYIIKAFEIRPKHSEVLWTMGNVRNAFKQTDIAIFCFKRIIELGIKNVINKDEDQDFRYAQMKINDSKFQLYRLYYDKGDLTLSKKYLAMYKRGLKKGIKTIYKPLEKFLMDSSSSSLFVIHNRQFFSSIKYI